MIGVDANPEAFEHARAKYTEVTFERNMIELWQGDVDCVVFLQTIEHIQDPDGMLEHIKALIAPGGVAYVSTPNVLTLAPKGQTRSGNPWHVREYQPGEYRELCERHFANVDLLGLFHARKLRAHQVAIEHFGWDRVHKGLHFTKPFYDRFTPGDQRARLRAAARRPGQEPRPARGAAPMTRLSIVLHTHMPYVEGFGTWPFGEEWLWEAIATSYLPLLDVLDAHPGKVTLSITPVLADQLEAPGALERCLAFLRDVRPASHGLDAVDHPEAAAQIAYSSALYESAAEALERRGDLIAAFAPHVTWTSAATHAVLPLLATDAGVRLQLETGIASHRRRFGHWDGGFWLPECAHAPWLDELLEEAGVHMTCVDWTDVGCRLAPARRRRRASSCPPRPRRDRPRLARDRLPGARRLPRLHRLTPARARAMRQRRRALRPRRAGPHGPARTPRPSSRASTVPPSWRSTPSCSGTTGTKA